MNSLFLSYLKFSMYLPISGGRYCFLLYNILNFLFEESNEYRYQPIKFSTLPLDMSDLLSNNLQERKDAVKRILNTTQSNLVEKDKENDRNSDRTVKDLNNKFPPTQRRR